MSSVEDRWYAGIGARKSPSEICDLMTQIAAKLATEGWGLRSGAAQGADAAFEKGARRANGRAEVFLPWRRFNQHPSSHYKVYPDALRIAAEVHPKWTSLSDGVKKLHGRNVYQVLGYHLKDPVRMVVCWTPDGAQRDEECGPETGGTATAIKIANKFGVRVFNLARPEVRARLEAYLNELAPMKGQSGVQTDLPETPKSMRPRL